MAKGARCCEWPTLQAALATFVEAADGTQGSDHILPLHWYVACRMVLEGGFHPDHVRPRPPFVVNYPKRGQNAAPLLAFDKGAGGGGERTVFGGLKTKNVDVVVTNPDIGPCIAVSMKGTLNAFRNLTNRMEEAVGDCTNLHIAYPALVYGFLHLFRANREGCDANRALHFVSPDDAGCFRPSDIALRSDGVPTEAIRRYHDVMVRLTGRGDVRDAATRYEAIALLLAQADDDQWGALNTDHPPESSPLSFQHFFSCLLQQYDLRFVYAAPALARSTTRIEWNPESPALRDARVKDYYPRVAADSSA